MVLLINKLIKTYHENEYQLPLHLEQLQNPNDTFSVIPTSDNGTISLQTDT